MHVVRCTLHGVRQLACCTLHLRRYGQVSVHAVVAEVNMWYLVREYKSGRPRPLVRSVGLFCWFRSVGFVRLFVCLPVLCFAALCARVFARACSLAFFPSLLPERVRSFVRLFILYVCLFYMFVCLFAWLRALAVRPAAALRLCGSATNAL